MQQVPLFMCCYDHKFHTSALILLNHKTEGTSHVCRQEQNFDNYSSKLLIDAKGKDTDGKIAYLSFVVGRDTVVGTMTRYELDGPGIEFRGGDFFRTCPDRA